VFSAFCVDRRLTVALVALFTIGRTHRSAPTPYSDLPHVVGADLRVGPGQDIPVARQVDLTITQGTSMSAAASPDRRSIAIDLLGGIWILPFNGGEAHRITPELLEARQPTWSPDGQSIAFQGYDDGTWHIYVIGRDGGEPKAITSGSFDDREPAWSRDGSRIAFSSDRYGGITSIWTVRSGGGEPRQVSTREGWMPFWSPDDQEIGFTSPNTDGGRPVPALYAVSANGGERLLFPVEYDRIDDMTPAAAAWDPDGTLIVYSSRIGGLVLGAPLATQGGRWTVTGPSMDVFPFKPQWLSASEYLYTANGRIWRSRITPGPRSQEGSPGSPRPGSVTMVPFTAKVTLQRSTYTIAHRPLEPAEPQRLTGIVNPVVSPDGSAIAFTAMGDLWVLPAGGSPVQITNDEAVEIDPAWSPDSSQLVYASDRGGHMDLWLHDLRTNRRAQLTEEHGAVSGPAWSPDGNHIAFLVDHRTLATLDVRQDSHGFTFTGATYGELGRPTWSADSNSIAVGALLPYSNRYREGLNQLLLYSTNSTGVSSSVIFPGHSAGNRQDNGPVWSPDGFRMAFVTEGALYVVPVDGSGGATGPPRIVATDQPESPSWEGDSKHIVYQTPRGLRRIISDGSVPEQIPLDLTWRNGATPERIVVHAGHILDGVFDAARGQSDIVIESGVIRSVEPHRDDLHSGVVVDASDEYVMPGLIEMHAHLDDGYGGNFGRVWLAYGITGLRVPAVNPYAGLEQREAFDSGRRPGPRVFVAGDPIDGARVYYPGGISVTSDEQLDAALDRAGALGVDFFKTYVRLPDRLQKRVVDFAHALNKPVTSHELFPAVAFGVDGIEHLSGTSRRGFSPKLSATGRAYQDVVDLIAKSGVTLTPTIGIMGAFLAREAGDRTVVTDPRLSLFPLPTVAQITEMAAMHPDPQRDRALLPYEATLKAVAAGGGTILAGTDSPIIPYALGLHVELESYVHAGLSPFQALQTATVNAAQALGVGDQIGTIEPGKLADLTFLGSDPLTDIRNTRDVKRVMRGGRLYTVADLLPRR
jgi:Tol biopolymer transport system component/imidazolonepropionase-like amidohydrolase